MKTHPIKSDSRWTVTREATGKPGPRFVVRFCGDRISEPADFATYPAAVIRAAGARAARAGALVVSVKSA